MERWGKNGILIKSEGMDIKHTEIILNALKLTNLSLNKDDHSILKDVSLNLSYGELYIILGKNGAGKSSLFKCIAGIESDYLGDIDKLMSDESSQGTISAFISLISSQSHLI